MLKEEVFFRLLKLALWGENVNVPDGFNDWTSVFALAKSQSVLGLVAHSVINEPILCGKIPDGVKAKLKAHIVANVATHNVLNNTLLQVITLLDASDVPSVLLKGQALARNYPIPELRACGDIDIYVGEENYIKACEVLGAISTWKENADQMKNDLHFDIKIGAITVEIHRFSDVSPSKYYNKIYQTYSLKGLREHLRRVDFSGITLYTPEDNFNAFYIFNHLWHHFITSGVGLRQLCDWMLFLHARKSEIDRAKLRMILEDMDLMKPWQAFGCVLVDQLGLPAEEFPFYDPRKFSMVRKIVKRIVEEGNFGHERAMFKNRSNEGYFKRKIKSLYLHTVRSLQLFFMFPSHATRHYWAGVRSGCLAAWTRLVSSK